MKILRIPSRGEPYVADIDNTLAAMQNEVGGYIEVVPISRKHRLVVNEEGKLGKYRQKIGNAQRAHSRRKEGANRS